MRCGPSRSKDGSVRSSHVNPDLCIIASPELIVSCVQELSPSPNYPDAISVLPKAQYDGKTRDGRRTCVKLIFGCGASIWELVKGRNWLKTRIGKNSVHNLMVPEYHSVLKDRGLHRPASMFLRGTQYVRGRNSNSTYFWSGLQHVAQP